MEIPTSPVKEDILLHEGVSFNNVESHKKSPISLEFKEELMSTLLRNQRGSYKVRRTKGLCLFGALLLTVVLMAGAAGICWFFFLYKPVEVATTPETKLLEQEERFHLGSFGDILIIGHNRTYCRPKLTWEMGGIQAEFEFKSPLIAGYSGTPFYVSSAVQEMCILNKNFTTTRKFDATESMRTLQLTNHWVLFLKDRTLHSRRIYNEEAVIKYTVNMRSGSEKTEQQLEFTRSFQLFGKDYVNNHLREFMLKY